MGLTRSGAAWRGWVVVRRTAGLLLLALLIWLLRDVAWRELVASVRTARPAWLAAAVLGQVVVLVLWAGIWRAFTPRGAVPFGRLLEAVTLTGTSLLVAPSLAGHAAGAALLVRRCGLKLSAAASVIAGEQVSEAAAKGTVLLLALLFAPLPGAVRASVLALAALFAAVAVGAVLLGKVWPRAPEVVRAHGALARGIACALAIKLVEALVLVAVQHSLGVELSAAQVLLLLALAAVGIAAGALLPIPGPFGAAEAVVAAGYTQLGLSLELSLALVAVHSATLLAPRLLGSALVLVGRPGRGVATG